MAEPQTTMERIGLTRGKAALVGVLAIALVGVIYLQYGPTAAGDGLAPSAERPRRPAALRSASDEPPQASGSDERAEVVLQAAVASYDQTRWQSPELTEVIAYDPFALPAAFPQRAVLNPHLAQGGPDNSAAVVSAKLLAAEVERMRGELEELSQRGVQVIVNQRNQYVAMIGDRTLHVGDEINGFTVAAIEPDGVLVEWKGLE